MPFKLGRSPVRRTFDYLEAGKVVLRENVKVFSVHYSYGAENHKGARDFVFWHLDQIQYKNPTVQCITFRDLTPSPFIRVFFDDTKDIIINLNCRKKNDILEHLVNFTAICKTEQEISQNKESLLKCNDSLFGYGCKRHCMCEILGQVPCPSLVLLPYYWRNSRKYDRSRFLVPYYYTEKGLDEIEE